MGITQLKNVRLGLGLSLRQAEEVSGVSFETVRRLESRLTTPRPETLERLALGYRIYALDRSIHYASQARMIS